MKPFLIFLVFIPIQIYAQTYNVRDFGAVGDGVTDDTHAVRATLRAVKNSNGGRVIFDYGYTFLTGCFNITDNTILDVRGTILASVDVKNYEYIPLLPWYGNFSGNITLQKQPIIFSYHANNITITGGGTIDGNGPVWYKCLSQNNKNDTEPPCYPYGRPRLVQPTYTTNILIDNIKLKDSPFWTLHLANCTNVFATNMHITSPPGILISEHMGYNTDGVDVDCSSNVTIQNSYIATADDAIAIKSGLNWFGRHYGQPSENILVQNLTIGYSNGLAIGSEMSGGVRNVTFKDCILNGSLHAIIVKTARERGGFIEDITYSNIQVYNTNWTFQISMFYSGYDVPPQNASGTPTIKNIVFNNITGDKNGYVWDFEGLPESPIQNLYLSNIENANWSKEYDQCYNLIGTCDEKTVRPSCPKCLKKERCFDAVNYCSQYVNICNVESYRPQMCDLCRKTCNLCNSC